MLCVRVREEREGEGEGVEDRNRRETIIGDTLRLTSALIAN